MQLYISSISNLTDARFFGAYGVSYFGFCFDVLDANAVTIDQAKSILAWLHEPEIIGQFGNHQSWEEMQYIHSQLPLHAVQVLENHPELDQINLPKWISTPAGIVDPNTSGIFISGDWTRDTLEQAVAQNPYGIHIACVREEKPGISRVDHYADLMEVLEPHVDQ